MASGEASQETTRKQKASLSTFLGLGALAIAPLAVGVGMLTVRHLSSRDLQAARTWIETPCVVEKCEFVTHDDERMLEVVYRYEFNGHEYQGDRLDLIIGRMGDDDIFEETIRKSHPAGSSATCFVDPADPARSVLDRDHGVDALRRMWLLAFPFLCVGIGFSLAVAVSLVDVLRGAKPEGPVSRSIHTADPGPPPRKVPLLTQVTVLAGGVSEQGAWLFVVGASFVFVILDGPAAYARLFDFWRDTATVPGRVTDVRELDERESYVSLYQYAIVYEIDGTTYTSDSYTRGRKYKIGDEVPIAYDRSSPGEGTIVGARPSNFTWWHSAIPLGVLLLLIVGLGGMYLHNLRAVRLLKHGQVAHAEWFAPQPTSEEALNDHGEVGSMLTYFHFQAGGTYHRAKKYKPASGLKRRSKSSSPERGDKVTVLYSPAKPARNVIVDGALDDVINGNRTVWEQLIHFAPAPLAWIALIALLRGAELI